MMNVIVLLVVGVVVAQAVIPDDGTCGLENVMSGRIIGGENIERCAWPYKSLVRLQVLWTPQLGENFGNRTICGGSLITDEYVVTAAVCAMPFYSDGAVRAGTRVLIGDVGPNGEAQESVSIRDVWVHPAYNNNTSDNNIAVIRLARKVTFNNCAAASCLESQIVPQSSRCAGPPQVDTTCVVAAVGLTNENSSFSDGQPQKADIVMYNRHVSGAIIDLNPRNTLPVGAVIGRTINPSVKVCLFDWGGIVACRSGGKYWLRGIISTSSCMVSNSDNLRQSPIFITEMAYYRTWIENCTNGVCSSLQI